MKAGDRVFYCGGALIVWGTVGEIHASAYGAYVVFDDGVRGWTNLSSLHPASDLHSAADRDPRTCMTVEGARGQRLVD